MLPREVVDLEHLRDYLDEVVDACEPEGDPRDIKGWYRGELLRDDRAIDRIRRSLRQKARTLPGRSTRARKAVAATRRYIRHRKDKMRYASLHSHKFARGQWRDREHLLGHGASGQARRPILGDLRPAYTLAVRGLVLSERWEYAWPPYAATHRKEIRLVA